PKNQAQGTALGDRAHHRAHALKGHKKSQNQALGDSPGPKQDVCDSTMCQEAINMAVFKNRRAAKAIAAKPCELCGWQAARRHAEHIIDEIKSAGDGRWNALSLCPNCATIFDDVIRPKLYRALTEYGATNLPPSWKKDNKISEAINAALDSDEIEGETDE